MLRADLEMPLILAKRRAHVVRGRGIRSRRTANFAGAHLAALDPAPTPCHHADVRADRRREISAVVSAIVAHVLFLTLAPRTPLIEIEKPPALVDVTTDTTIDIDSTPSSESNPSSASP